MTIDDFLAVAFIASALALWFVGIMAGGAMVAGAIGWDDDEPFEDWPDDE